MNSEKGKILIAYFSHSGNTRVIAKEIQRKIGGDLFEIATVTTYPQDYNSVVSVARQEQMAKSRPPLKDKVEDMSVYSVVFVGYPNWWSTMPMAVFNFLERYDFTGKTILPFCTHEGSRMGRSEKDIASLCPEAVLFNGLPIRGSEVAQAQAAVATWLRQAHLLD